jgi:hypothetical protein
MPRFDLAAALQAGYEPTEVLRYLAGKGVSSPTTYEGTDEDKIRQLLRDSGGKVLLPYTYAPADLPRAAAPIAPLDLSSPGATGRTPRDGSTVPAGLTPAPLIRRNMTPEEVETLWSQGEQGLQPTLAPMSLLDLAMEPIGAFLEEADVGKYLLPLSLLGMVRYKKPGVSAGAKQAAEAYHKAPLRDPMAVKNTVFHATDPESVEKILKAGEIVPDPNRLERTGMPDWKSFLKLKHLDPAQPIPQQVLDKFVQEGKVMFPDKLKRVAADYYGITTDDPNIWRAVEDWRNPPAGLRRTGQDFYRALGYFDEDEVPKVLGNLGYRIPSPSLGRGVSVSRVPRVSSKESKALSFVIDQSKMPPTMPFTEWGYRKTIPHDKPTWPGYINPRFEFENRTFDQSIPMSAVREMWVDRSAVPGGLTHDLQGHLQNMRDLAEQYSIPLREFESGREMHQGRATLSDLVKKKRRK